MQVAQIEPGYWEVSDGTRWWSVKELDKPPWALILNESLREVSPTGRLGQRILNAIEPD